MNSLPPRQSSARLFARFFVPLGIVAGTVILLVVTSSTALRGAREARVVPVASISLERTNSDAREDGLLAAGWIEPAPYEVLVPSRKTGIVESVHVLEGDQVHAGDLLVTLRSEDEQLALNESDAALAEADAEIAAMSAARDLAYIEAERALEPARAAIDARARVADAEASIRVLAASITEATALRDEAEDERLRKSKLVVTGGASEGEVARLEKRVASLDAKRLALVEEISAREASLHAARDTLALAENDLERKPVLQLRVAEVEAQLKSAIARRASRAARLEAVQLAFDRSKIVAPIDGVVLRRSVVPGAFLELSDDAPIALYDPLKLQIRCDVPLKEAGKLARGLVAEIRVDAIPNAIFRGAILRIDPVADIQKNTVRCKVSIDAGSADPVELATLRPEMLARVRILAGNAASSAWRGEGVAVPKSALRVRDENRATVLVAMPDGNAARAEQRSIVLGRERANGWIEVREGLAAGDRVVLETAIEDGMRIMPREELAADLAEDAPADGSGASEDVDAESSGVDA